MNFPGGAPAQEPALVDSDAAGNVALPIPIDGPTARDGAYSTPLDSLPPAMGA